MDPQRRLDLLATLHYVYGALTCVLGLFALVLLGMGVFLNSDLLAAEAQQPPPEWLGSFFGIIGVAVFVLVEGIGLLNILSGRWIKHRRNRTGSIIVAAIDCLNMPLGIALGIFTIVSLSNDRVSDLYAANSTGS